jgi:hypothetical protein
MQLIKDLWGVVQALLAVVKTLVSYVRIAIHAVENLIGKLSHKKEAVVATVEPVAAPVVDAPAPAPEQTPAA